MKLSKLTLSRLTPRNLREVISTIKTLNSNLDSKKFIAVIFVQTFLSLLDLIGLVLTGVLGSLFALGQTDQPTGSRVMTILQIIRIDEWKTNQQIVLIGLIILAVLLGKTVLSAFVMKKITKYLSWQTYETVSSVINILIRKGPRAMRIIPTSNLLYALTTSLATSINGVLIGIISLIGDFILVIILTIGLSFADPVLSLIVVFYFSIIALINYSLLKRRVKNAATQNSQDLIQSNALAEELLLASEEIYVNNQEDSYKEAILSLRRKIAKNSANLSYVPYITRYVFELSIVMIFVSALLIQYNTRSLSTSLGILGMFFLASFRIGPAVLRIQQTLLTLQQQVGMVYPSILDLRIMNSIQDQRDTESTLISSPMPIVKFKKVSFSFNNSKPILDSFDLEVEPGEAIALVGDSGSGKSTLISLLLGIANPSSGEITIGDLSPLDLVKNNPGFIGYVPQHPFFRDGTIRENLKIGNLGIGLEDNHLRQLLRLVRFSLETREDQDILDVKLENRGAGLSGGQKQKLAICRALMRSPKLLILDEATNALDDVNQRVIAELLKDLKGAVTMIIVAHNELSLDLCDRRIRII